MYFQQFYLGCLAQASYLIGDAGEGAVVDPRRDIEEYLEAAARQGLVIRHIIETHLHADFVSGHRELAARTGAKIWIGAAAAAAFAHEAATEDREIHLGATRLRFLETPGHTPESISILVFDHPDTDEPWGVLTGDALFIGDVGRPDLAAGGTLTAADLAGMLYDSLHGKLLTLPATTRVYPAHGAGSLCGRNMSKETSSTIGDQRRFNYALQPMSRDEFIRVMTADLPEAPAYFREDARINREGPALLSARHAPLPLAPEEVVACGAFVLDTRSSEEFAAGHLPGSLDIGLGGQFAAWAGALIPLDADIVLIAASPAAASEAATRLARVGIERVTGFLDDGVEAWDASGRPLVRTPRIAVNELAERLMENAGEQLLDVRRPGEWAGGVIAGARRLTLSDISRQATTLDPARPVTVICAGGYRSIMAAGLLERAGFRDVTDVVGGMAAWTAAKYPVA